MTLRARRATIVDIAAVAGVSFKTVSRVLNGGPNVRDATRQRVLGVANDLSYRANPHARNLRAPEGRQIAVFTSKASRNYLTEIQIGILQHCNLLGFSAIFEDASDKQGQLLSLNGSRRLSGVVLVPPLADDRDLIDRLIDARIRFVRLSPDPLDGEAGHVSMDDERAAEEMTEHLMDLGHQRIAWIAGPEDHPVSRLREKGFRTALARRGLDLLAGCRAEGDFQVESGLRAAEEMLSSAHPPTAIFASNDDMAAGVLAVAYRRRIAVPAALSVAGFDDTPLASIMAPSLTTVYQPIREMASLATDILLSRPGARPVASQVMAHRIVIRETTAPPAGHGAD
jgi:LacI family transcriptional regulator